MLKTVGYSLWLVPGLETEMHSKLAGFIDEIAVKYKLPAFLPHLTLLGCVGGTHDEIFGNTAVLAQKLAPYEIEIVRVDSQRTVSRCLFCEVAQTDSVMNAYNLAQQVFSVDKGKYFPHISLAYANSLKDIADLRMWAERQRAGGLDFLTARQKFTVKEIQLWRSEGTVEEWYYVGNFPFGKGS